MTGKKTSASKLELLLALLLLGVATVYALQTYSVLYNTGFNAPFLDQYAFYPTYIEQAFPQNIIQPENGHRPIFPALVRVVEINYFHADQSLQRIVGTVLTTAAWLGLVLLCLYRQGLGLLRQATIVVVVTLAFFWLGNVRMLVHGSEQLHVYGVLSGLVLALALMYRMHRQPTLPGFGCMVAAAFFATFCFGNGLVVFPTLMVMAFLLRWPWRWQFAVAAATGFAALLYTRWLPSSEVNPLPALGSIPAGAALTMSWLNSAVNAAWLNLGAWDLARIDYLGHMALHTSWIGHAAKWVVNENLPLQSSLRLTFWLGLFCTVLAAVIVLYHVRRGVQTRLQFVALSLMVFAAGTAALIVLFRVDYFQSAGSSQLFADRYVPWSCLWWLGLGLYALSWLPQTGGKTSRFGPAVWVLFIAWALSLSHVTNMSWAGLVRQHLVQHSFAVANGFDDPAELVQLSTVSLEDTQFTLALLKQRKLAQFHAYPAMPGKLTMPQGVKALGARIDTTAATNRFIGKPGVLEFTGSLPLTSTHQKFERFAVFDNLGEYCGMATISHAGDAASPRWLIGVQEKLGFYGLMFCNVPPERTRLYAQDQSTTWFDLGSLR